MKKFYALIIFVFIIALAVRFSYFPKNVYFSYDQARDFFFASDILNGDIRLIGPPSAASDKIFPGPLFFFFFFFFLFFFFFFLIFFLKKTQKFPFFFLF